MIIMRVFEDYTPPKPSGTELIYREFAVFLSTMSDMHNFLACEPKLPPKEQHAHMRIAEFIEVAAHEFMVTCRNSEPS